MYLENHVKITDRMYNSQLSGISANFSQAFSVRIIQMGLVYLVIFKDHHDCDCAVPENRIT